MPVVVEVEYSNCRVKLACVLPRNNFLPFPTPCALSSNRFSSSTFNLQPYLFSAACYLTAQFLSAIYSHLSSLSLFIPSLAVVDRTFCRLCVTSKFVDFSQFFVRPCPLIRRFLICVTFLSKVFVSEVS